MTDREVIRDIVQMRLKHEEISCDDCKVSKQYFKTLENYTQLVAWNGHPGRVNEHGWPTSRGQLGQYKWYQILLAISVLTQEAS